MAHSGVRWDVQCSTLKLSCLCIVYLSASAAAVPTNATANKCRCVPPLPCWDTVPWAELNVSVSGRLEKSVGELKVCIDDVASDACTTALNKTDDEFWLADKPNGYQHTGLYGRWNTSKDLSEYAVKAETEADFVETVKFAGKHNLRLVVKATGHDWYGRSTAAGSLLLWTHQRKNITWHSAFPAPEARARKASRYQRSPSNRVYSSLTYTLPVSENLPAACQHKRSRS